MKRNYDRESVDNKERKYAYNFDFDIMHPFMLKAFEPFIRGKNALELGCFQGAFTERIVERFQEVTCVEASKTAIDLAKTRLKNYQNINFVHSLFEETRLEKKYDTIFL